jgi:hypothetical protein
LQARQSNPNKRIERAPICAVIDSECREY